MGAPSPGHVKFKAERGLGTVRGGRSLRVSCYVRSVVPSHDGLRVWPEIAGESAPARDRQPTNAQPQPEYGNSELTSIVEINEPSWLEGAELLGPPVLWKATKRGGANPPKLVPKLPVRAKVSAEEGGPGSLLPAFRSRPLFARVPWRPRGLQPRGVGELQRRMFQLMALIGFTDR